MLAKLKNLFVQDTNDLEIMDLTDVERPINIVDNHWTKHTITTRDIKTIHDSLAYVKQINEWYPCYFDLCHLYDPHDNEVVLDYGCGPGNDLVGYYEYSKAKSIIGIDISLTALKQARSRLKLHGSTKHRIQLIKKNESNPEIPLPDNSVDYFQSLGVIHHTSDPHAVLTELYRVLKKGEKGRVMIYNYNSLYIHLNIAYEMQLLEKKFQGKSAYEAFQSFGDNGAPICLAYTPDKFVKLCEQAGFQTKFSGAAFSINELQCWDRHKDSVLDCNDLPQEHRNFLTKVSDGKYPKYEGANAGMDAVFELYKS